jgi:hypothetical protein
MERHGSFMTIGLDWLRRIGATLLRGARGVAHVAGPPAVRAVWLVAKPVLKRGLEFLLALIIVFEEWGWRPLAELLGQLARWRPWAVLESVIVRLPPYAALLVFALPTLLLLPLKFLALFLVANGQLVLATALFVAAKVVATALVARLFLLTQPALMRIGWFAWGYDTIMPWKEALVDRVHASWAWRVGRVVKERARRAALSEWRRWRPVVLRIRAALAVRALELRALGRRALRDLRQRWAAFRAGP